jgi:hypothetical protein
VIVQMVDVLRQVVKVALEPLSGPVARVRSVVAVYPGLALLVLGLLVLAAVLAIRGDRLMALALIPLSLVWLVVDNAFEGPVLLALSWSHGVTASDLLSVVGLGIAAWRLAPLLAVA